MKHSFLKHGGSRLLVVALGWGQSCDAWLWMDYGARDVLFLYQWDASGELPDLSGYERVDLLAWSFGVWAASQLDFGVRLAHATAVNGTLFPVDDRCGIPQAIFQRTLDGWRMGQSGSRFWRRMGSDREPDRSDEDLLHELQWFQNRFQAGGHRPTFDYSCAVIGLRDRIFPARQQQRAWRGKTQVQELDMPHDMSGHFEEILRLALGYPVLDKHLVAQRFSRSAETYDRTAVVQRDMAKELHQMMGTRCFGRALEFGCGTGLFTELLRPQCQRLFRNDLLHEEAEDYLEGDVEALSLPENLDLIAGNAVWQWLQEPRHMVRKIHDALNEDGVVAVSSFAPGTMGELEEVLGVALNYKTAEEFRDMFSACFQVTAFKEYQRVLTFQSPLEVLRHLKRTGVTAAGGRFQWTRGKLAVFEQEYRRKFPAVTLTYRPMLLVAVKTALY